MNSFGDGNIGGSGSRRECDPGASGNVIFRFGIGSEARWSTPVRGRYLSRHGTGDVHALPAARGVHRRGGGRGRGAHGEHRAHGDHDFV